MTIQEKLAKLEAAGLAASKGKSWIDLLQSNGCEVRLFDSQYTVWLSCKKEEFRQSEKDAEFIIAATTEFSGLVGALREAVATLQYINKGGNTGGWDTDCEDYEERAAAALETISQKIGAE